MYAALRRLYTMPPGRVLLACAAVLECSVDIPAGTSRSLFFFFPTVVACAHLPVPTHLSCQLTTLQEKHVVSVSRATVAYKVGLGGTLCLCGIDQVAISGPRLAGL